MPEFFAKYHALGNDYIVIDPQKNRLELTPEAVRLLCDRNRGIGSDGVLWGPFREAGLPRVRIYNPDGGEAEKSGNGVRLFARYLRDSGQERADKFIVLTAGGESEVEFGPDGAVKACLGVPVFESGKIPVAGPPREVLRETLISGGKAYSITCLSLGNPHCVVLCDSVSKELAVAAGPGIETSRLFPNRINVQFLQALDSASIRIEIWERGAGYTLSSGSSACAAACAARKLGLAGDKVRVEMPGGAVAVETGRDGKAFISGPVCAVAYGEIAAELLAAARGAKCGS